ncbi:hypothetical protein [Sneathiella sp.]|uniref:hypothetical protein n=1 Tax=Sneathiella sp. TaxID=1964365 RepID=UPI002632ED70|nr:hypothetical protein [Sneathiella sp.]MDF2368310.1 hypothetical protein [Sneathiella sp.]
MKRVLVVGCAGAGKSTFSQELAWITELPLISLDRHFWLPGWVESDLRVFASKVRELAEDPKWVMDGNYGRTLSARLAYADTVIFLDMPRMLCLWRVIKRTAGNYGRVRDGMPHGCPERLDWNFLRYIWHFNSSHRPRLEESLRTFDGRIVTLRNRREVDTYLADLKAV